MALYSVTAGNTALAADLNQYKSWLVDGTDTSTTMGIGAAAAAGVGSVLAFHAAASAGNAVGMVQAPTLTAAANSDTLTILNLHSQTGTAATFATAAKTGLTAYGLAIAANQWASSGGGTFTTASAAFLKAPMLATANWAALLDGHIGSTGTAPSIINTATGLSSANIVAGSTDLRGEVTITATSSPPAAGTRLFSISLATAYASGSTSAGFVAAVPMGTSGSSNFVFTAFLASTTQIDVYTLLAIPSLATMTVGYLVVG